MNKDNLIETILKEVTKKLNDINIDVVNSSKTTLTPNIMSMKNNKKALITYSPCESNINDLKSLLTDNNIDSYYINDYDNIDSKGFDFLIVPYLSNDMIFNIANGIKKNCKTLNVISQFFLNNKMVYFVNDGIELLKFKSTSNVKYYNYLYKNIDIISTFCCKFLNCNELIEICNPSLKFDNVNNKTFSEPKRKRLITEKDILSLKQSGQTDLTVEKGTIITALAKDVAKNLGINIIV